MESSKLEKQFSSGRSVCTTNRKKPRGKLMKRQTFSLCSSWNNSKQYFTDSICVLRNRSATCSVYAWPVVVLCTSFLFITSMAIRSHLYLSLLKLSRCLQVKSQLAFPKLVKRKLLIFTMFRKSSFADIFKYRYLPRLSVYRKRPVWVQLGIRGVASIVFLSVK